jgi:competence protein ComEC
MGARPLAVASAALAAGAWAGVSCSKPVGVAWASIGLAFAALLWLRWGGSSKGRSGLWRRARWLCLATAPVLAAASLGVLRGALAKKPALDAGAPILAWVEDLEAARGGREPLWLEARVEETAFAREGARVVLAVARSESAPGSAMIAAPGGLRALVAGPRTLHKGDELRALVRLHRPEPQRNPGGRDLRKELAARGIALTGTLDPQGQILLSRGPPIFRWLDELRDRFSQRCQELGTTPQRAAVISALGVGDRAGLDLETDEELTDSGLVHLLSSAGLHLAIAALLAERLLRFLFLRLPWTRRRRASGLAAVCALPFVVAQVLLLGAPWPAIRAGFAACVALSAPLLSRRFDSLTGLLFGLALCGLWDPASLAGMPLALSFAGVLGLILLAPRLREWVPIASPPPGTTLRAHPWLVAREEILRLFCASAAAALCTAPLMAAAFHRISLISAFANALGIWPGLLALPIASIAAPLQAISPALALPLIWAADLLAGALLGCSQFFASVPFAAVDLPAPSLLTSALWTLALLLLAGFPAPLSHRAHALRERPGTLVLRASIPLLLIALFAGARSAIARAQGHLEATFLSVGQGDSAIVRFPDGSTMLIDGGGDLRDLPVPVGASRLDPGTRDVLPALAELGISHLDLVVLSHPHPDHAGGLFAVLRTLRVDELWVTGEPGPGDIGGKISRAARARGVQVREPKPGDIWERGGARVEVLAPAPAWDIARSTNDNSLVLRVVHGEVALLFAGDVEALAEAQLAQSGKQLRAQLLKAGHHGSRTSSTDAFLRAVAPGSVVLSMGAQNRFGFPHPEVVARIEALGARTFRTDQGAVIAESDGKTLRVHSFAPH